MPTIDGGPAFPRAEGPNSAQRDGMSLRDYFAGVVMLGLLQHPDRSASCARQVGVDAAEWVAKCAYEGADAMLAERAKVRP